MSNITQDDIDMLYWHAMSKMRTGNFHGAYQFFRYVYDLRPSFHVGLAKAYCAIRNGDLEIARQVLFALTPQESRERKFYERLKKRVESK